MTFVEKHADKITAIPEAGCFIWMGSDNGKYGTVYANGHIAKAHRESIKDVVGNIPAGLDVCHSCDVTFCVNPAHLFLGTRSDNVQDMLRKGRDNKISRARGECHGMSKFTPSDILAIRSLHESGLSNAAIGRRFNSPRQTIRYIVTRKTWSHI